MSARFGGHSVWLFGDTFFSEPAADGYQWRSSSWSWTDDVDSSDGLSGWTHALGADGKPRQAIPHTPEEQAFNDAHKGNPCIAGSDCGARHTPWPAGGLVVDPATGWAWVMYNPMVTHPSSEFAFSSLGTSLALWRTPLEAAERSSVTSGVSTILLFGADEPNWGAGALLENGLLYAYSCTSTGHGSGCLLGRVESARALDRSAWRFWDGHLWAEDWHKAQPVFDGAPYVTVSYNAAAGRYLAWYMPPLNNKILARSALRPEGPWSAPQEIGTGQPSRDPNNWDYALVGHPELDRDRGKTITLSYYQPGAFLDGTVHLVEVRLGF